jgi:DNA-binding protein HU-beta
VNKADIIESVSQEVELTKADAGRAVEAVLNAITAGLKRGDEVSIVGFGSFKVKHRAARAGRNPKTGEEIQIGAANVPSFKPGKGLKDSVN